MKRTRREDSRQITAVLYRGASGKVLRALRRAGINTAVMCRARGSSVGDPEPLVFEKDVLTVLVPASRADRVFDLICGAADVDRPYGAFLTMAKVARRTDYRLPEVVEEKPD